MQNFDHRRVALLRRDPDRREAIPASVHVRPVLAQHPDHFHTAQSSRQEDRLGAREALLVDIVRARIERYRCTLGEQLLELPGVAVSNRWPKQVDGGTLAALTATPLRWRGVRVLRVVGVRCGGDGSVDWWIGGLVDWWIGGLVGRYRVVAR